MAASSAFSSNLFSYSLTGPAYISRNTKNWLRGRIRTYDLQVRLPLPTCTCEICLDGQIFVFPRLRTIIEIRAAFGIGIRARMGQEYRKQTLLLVAEN